MLQNKPQQNTRNQDTTRRTQASSIVGSPIGGILSGSKKAKDKWRHNNPEYHKEWYLKNKERVSKMAKIYRKKYFSNPVNKEKKSKYQKEFEALGDYVGKVHFLEERWEKLKNEVAHDKLLDTRDVLMRIEELEKP